ncbi:hypothetical protein C9374_000868 [Naegleria lovaniensis]|uniref:Uncharacterized protein n=1 Tax=Naegleria lovaniensis TaxID=51637 RepID=A0AA88GYK2_NAELO|nr:uncharacterized protein C9374_000868 [Naegleria lovaniensis]KAG2388018.1 hypothetical protein C9374_000868 [Naegleria lovaniensis]
MNRPRNNPSSTSTPRIHSSSSPRNVGGNSQSVVASASPQPPPPPFMNTKSPRQIVPSLALLYHGLNALQNSRDEIPPSTSTSTTTEGSVGSSSETQSILNHVKASSKSTLMDSSSHDGSPTDHKMSNGSLTDRPYKQQQMNMITEEICCQDDILCGATPYSPRRFPRVEFSNHAIKFEKKVQDSTQTIRIHKEHEDRLNLVHECIKQIHSPVKEQVQLGIATLKELDSMMDDSIRYDQYHSPYEKKMLHSSKKSFNVHSRYLDPKKPISPQKQDSFSPQFVSKQFKNTSPRYLDYESKQNREKTEQQLRPEDASKLQHSKNITGSKDTLSNPLTDHVKSPQKFSSSKLYPQHHSRYNPLYYSPKKGVKRCEQVNESPSKPSSPLKGISSPITSKSPQIIPKGHSLKKGAKKINDHDLKMLMESGSLDDYNDDFVLHRVTTSATEEDSEVLSLTLGNSGIEDDDLVVTDHNSAIVLSLSPPPHDDATIVQDMLEHETDVNDIKADLPPVTQTIEITTPAMIANVSRLSEQEMSLQEQPEDILESGNEDEFETMEADPEMELQTNDESL